MKMRFAVSRASVAGHAAIVGSIALLTSHTSAAIINVPGDQPSIQAAIVAATAGDEVVIQPGTYVELIDFMGKPITVRSSSGDPSDTTIDGNGMGTVVTCATNEGPLSTLEGLTITGGDAPGPDYEGGGMYAFNSRPTVRCCRFLTNVALGPALDGAGEGGAIYGENSFPTVSDCVFEGNDAGVGGAIRSVNSLIVIADCLFEANVGSNGFSGSGGAVAGSANISGCTFTGNSASGICNGDGGALQNVLAVDDCTFTDNCASGGACGGGATGFGGAINGATTVTNCTFALNGCFGATTAGGAVRGVPELFDCHFTENVASGSQSANGGAVAGATLVVRCSFDANSVNPGASGGGGGLVAINTTIVNSRFAGNSSNLFGSAIYCPSGQNVVRNCTFAAQGGGTGGVFLDGAGLIMTNSVVWGAGSNISGFPAPDVRYSTIEGGFAGEGNIDADPLFADAEQRLASGSPCIDAGRNAIGPCLADLDGHVRYVDDPATADSGAGTAPIIDMGAYEFGSTQFGDSGLPCGDCNDNGIPDATDIASGTAADCNDNGVPDSCDIDDGAPGDCNANGVPDDCDITDMTSLDDDGNGIPDECDAACPSDTDGSGTVDVDDLIAVILDWLTDGSNNNGDVDTSGLVDVDDLVQIILDWGDCQ